MQLESGGLAESTPNACNFAKEAGIERPSSRALCDLALWGLMPFRLSRVGFGVLECDCHSHDRDDDGFAKPLVVLHVGLALCFESLP